MLFSSITFLYFFLPITLVISFMAPKKYKNHVLLIASFFFYAWGSFKYTALLLGVILIGYFSGILIEKRKNARAVTIICIGAMAASLVVCKYVPWLSELGNGLSKGNIPVLKWMLPVGISFYTFQMISYIYDVYIERLSAERNFVHLATYISMFPQLIAGPIVRYDTVKDELNERSITWNTFSYGVRRFVIGLSKKVLLADVIGELVSMLKEMDGKNTEMYWVLMIAFSLQLYLDFSGYSDMAIGLGSMLGFHIPENFQYPFIAKSITEFWRRWHISLSSWFRDYVYIPLGGNRVKTGRWMINMLVVWGLSGLWHGAGGHFLTWGIYFGIWLILEKLWLYKLLQKLSGWVLHIYTLLVVMISFTFFQMDTLKSAFQVIAGLFGVCEKSQQTVNLGQYQIRKYIVVLMIGAFASTPIMVRMIQHIKKSNGKAEKIIDFLEPVVLAGLLFLSTAFLLNSSFHPFLYFRF